jgi:hypothetical protein
MATHTFVLKPPSVIATKPVESGKHPRERTLQSRNAIAKSVEKPQTDPSVSNDLADHHRRGRRKRSQHDSAEETTTPAEVRHSDFYVRPTRRTIERPKTLEREATLPWNPRKEHEHGWHIAEGTGRPIALVRHNGRLEQHRLARFGFQQWELCTEDLPTVLEGDRVQVELHCQRRKLMPVSCIVLGADNERILLRPVTFGHQQAVASLMLVGDALRQPERSNARVAPNVAAGCATRLVFGSERVNGILRAMAESGSEGSIEAEDGVMRLRLRAIQGDEVIWEVVEATSRALVSPLNIQFSGPLACYTFRAHLTERGENLLRTRIPEKLSRRRMRRKVRAQVGPSIRIRFEHPLWRFPIERQVDDVSSDGLSFKTIPAEDLLVPGFTLFAELLDEHGHCVDVNLEILRAFSGFPTEITSCAARVLSGDSAEWQVFARRYTHPHVDSEQHAASEVWDVYTKSGYLHISAKTPEAFATVKANFERCHDKLIASPALGARFLWRTTDGQAIASYSMVRSYAKSVFALQLAKVPGKEFDGVRDTDVLRELLSKEVEYVLGADELRYRITYAAPGVKFSRLFTHEFARSLRSTSAVDIRAMNCYELPVSHQVGLAGREPTIAPCLQPPLELLEWLGEMRPFIYRDAYDYAAETPFPRAAKRWHDVGLQRERFFLTLHSEAGTAVAVVETADQGIHLYDFLNSARIFVIEGDSPYLMAAMLRQVNAFFAKRGNERFILFDEDMTDGAVILASGGKLLGTSVATIVDVELLPEQTDYLFEMLLDKSG